MLFNYLRFILKLLRAASITLQSMSCSLWGQPLLTSPHSPPEILSCKKTSLGLEPHTKGQCQQCLSTCVEEGQRLRHPLCAGRLRAELVGLGWVEPQQQLVWWERPEGLGGKRQLKFSVIDWTCPRGRHEVRECVTVWFSFSSPPFLFFCHQMQISRCVFTA